MNDEDTDPREETLTRLMAQYEEALAAGTPAAELDESAAQLDRELATEWEGAKSCLELLDRARRQGPPPKGDSGEAAAERPRYLGRFKIQRELGRGGLGIVYLAEDPRLGRQVAIKVPRCDALASDDLRRRFLREAAATARLSHPHLVALHEVGEDGPVCYLVSEYCPGPTLAQWLLKRASPVPTDQAALLVLQLAEAVEHAHSRGVLHRDIKPANVLLETTVAGGEPTCQDQRVPLSPKLTDFGMAKLLEQVGGETRSGAIIGTLAYMSPEQAEGRVDQLDARTDVYALGAMLYELVVGAAPFRGKTDVDTLRQLMASEPVAPRDIRRDTPRDLEAIALKCLEKEPARRYDTARDLAADLQRYLNHEPTLARPLTGLRRATRWARRRPTAAALVVVSFVSVVVLLAGGLLYSARLRRHTEELRQAIAANEEAQAVVRIHDDEARRSYPSDMRLAQQAWNDGRVDDATILLEKHRPQTSQPDHRTFAWHFLWPICHLEARTFDGHAGPVYVCRYSPDGRILASAGEDGQMRLWDPKSGKLERSWVADDQEINGISFSPDGKWLAATGENSAAVWEVATGQLARRLDTGAEKVFALAFTPDGRTLLVGGPAAVELWDTADWSPHEQLNGDGKPIRMLVVSSDGTTLASTTDDSSIRLWDLSSRRLTATLEGHTRMVTSIAFSHDGKMLVSTSEDGRVKLWDVVEHRERATFESHRGSVHDVAFTPDDRWVVSADRRVHAQFWEVGNGRPGHALWSRNSEAYTVAVSPDGRQVATGGGDGVVRVWDGAAEPGMIRMADAAPGRAVDISPNSRTVALGDYSGNVRLYDLATRKLLKQFSAHGDQPISDIRFSPRGDILATAGNDNAVRLWHFPDLVLLHTLLGHHATIRNVSISPNGALVASCSQDKTVKVWDTASGALRHDLRPNDIALDVSFSPDGHLLAAGFHSGNVRIWHVADGRVAAALGSHQNNVECIAWSPDGKLLATAGIDDFILLWDLQALAAANRILADQGRIRTMTFSPDGKTLATGDIHRTIKLWDVASREAILVLKGHGTTVEKVGFAEDGDLLYSLGNGQPCELFLWPARREAETRSDPIAIGR